MDVLQGSKVLKWSSLSTLCFLKRPFFYYIVILSSYEMISDFNKEETYEFECAIDFGVYIRCYAPFGPKSMNVSSLFDVTEVTHLFC